MYAIYDGDTHLRTVRSPKNLRTPAGVTLADSSAMSASELASHGVYPVSDPGQPDTTWQCITGQHVEMDGGVATLAYEVEPIALEEAKAQLIVATKQVREHAIAGGIAWERVPGETHVLDTNEKSERRLTAAYNMARDGHVPSGGTTWVMADNSRVRLTAAELLSAALAVSAHITTCYEIFDGHADAIGQLADMDACMNYDPAAGYPALPQLTQE